MSNIGIYGAGMLGRNIVRKLLLGWLGSTSEVVGVSDPNTTVEKFIYFLLHDTRYPEDCRALREGYGTVTVTDEGAYSMIDFSGLLGHKYFYFSSDENPNWNEIHAEIVIDCTGTSSDSLNQHLSNGAQFVIGNSFNTSVYPTVAYGVNTGDLTSSDSIIGLPKADDLVCSLVLGALNLGGGDLINATVTSITSYPNGGYTQDSIFANNSTLYVNGRSTSFNIVATGQSAGRTAGRVIAAYNGKITGEVITVPVNECGLVRIAVRSNDGVEKFLGYLESGAADSHGLDKGVEFSTSRSFSQGYSVSSDVIGNSKCSIDTIPTTPVDIHGVYEYTINVWYDEIALLTAQNIYLADFVSTLN